MAVDWSPIFVLVLFFVTLILCFKPAPKLGILNLLFGMVGVVVSCLSWALPVQLPFHPWFSLVYLMLCVVCIYVGSTARDILG